MIYLRHTRESISIFIIMEGCETMSLTEQRKESMYKYAKAKLKRIPLDVQKEKYDEIKAAATAAGESVNGYIKKAVEERMARDSK